MKYDEKEIKNRTKTILDSASKNYDFKIIKAVFRHDELIIVGRDKGKKASTWLV